MEATEHEAQHVPTGLPRQRLMALTILGRLIRKAKEHLPVRVQRLADELGYGRSATFRILRDFHRNQAGLGITVNQTKVMSVGPALLRRVNLDPLSLDGLLPEGWEC